MTIVTSACQWLGQGWPKDCPQAASSPPISCTFFKHRVSDCRQ